MLDISRLNGIVPAKVLGELPKIMDRYELNTPLRLAHFLAQCAHESAGFTRVTENLKYNPERLMQVFPRHFPTLLSTKAYAHKPEAIANKVYAGRIGNGTEKSGDGWKFRGRGYIQLTGKANYQDFANYAKLLSILINPDLVATEYPLQSAAWFWVTRKLNEVADTNDLNRVTKIVNGGYHGLEDRRAWFNKIYSAL